MILNRHVIDGEKISKLTVGQTASVVCELIKSAPTLGELSVRELSCMSLGIHDPIGIYIFGNDIGKILYVGKTHGRSFHERMISHLDSRDPVEGSPHLAALVSTQVKRDPNLTRIKAVENILNMRMLWIPIEKCEDSSIRKELIALVERRLQWSQCLDPAFNSERVKKNAEISLRGKKRTLTLSSNLFSLTDHCV